MVYLYNQSITIVIIVCVVVEIIPLCIVLTVIGADLRGYRCLRCLAFEYGNNYVD